MTGDNWQQSCNTTESSISEMNTDQVITGKAA